MPYLPLAQMELITSLPYPQRLECIWCSPLYLSLTLLIPFRRIIHRLRGLIVYVLVSYQIPRAIDRTAYVLVRVHRCSPKSGKLSYGEYLYASDQYDPPPFSAPPFFYPKHFLPLELYENGEHLCT